MSTIGEVKDDSTRNYPCTVLLWMYTASAEKFARHVVDSVHSVHVITLDGQWRQFYNKAGYCRK